GDKNHTITATAKSGAGSKKVGVAGSLALNIVNGTRTEATVRGGANVNAGTGDITVKAESAEPVTAGAVADAKAGTVGVGASVAINVLTTDHTWAVVEDGAILTNGHDVAITAVNVVLVHTAATTSRNITGAGAITITSTSTVDVGGEVHASAKGESQSGQSADTQADNSVNKNSNSGGMTGTLPSANDQAS